MDKKKISFVILFILFVLGIILAGFLLVKNNNQPSSNQNIQEADLAAPPPGGSGPGNP